MKIFEKTAMAGWGDIDFNSHMRNTAYLDKSADVRMMFFSENGFPMSEFKKLKMGPVIMKDEIDYFRETLFLSEFKITLSIAGMADDGSRLEFRNEFFHLGGNSDGKMAARLNSTGGWISFENRQLIAAPEALLRALNQLEKTSDFRQLTSSLKPK